MDRVEFVNSLSFPDDIVPGIIKFFDQTMCLYNIIGGGLYSNINANGDDQSVCFDIKFESNEPMVKLESIINSMGNQATIYGRIFIIQCAHVDDTNMSVTVMAPS